MAKPQKKRDKEVRFYEWNIDRWFMSETRLSCTLEARSIYRDLLDYCYRHGSIPKLPIAQAGICNCTVAQIETAWPLISSKFLADKHLADRLRNKQADVFRKNFFTYLGAQSANSRKKGSKSVPQKATGINDISNGGSSTDDPVLRTKNLELSTKTKNLELSTSEAPPPPSVRTALEIVRSIEPGEDWFEEIYTRHPKKKDRGLAQSMLAQSASQPGFSRAEFDRVHKLCCIEWAKEKAGFAPTLAQWILDQGWKYPPAESQPENSGPGPPFGALTPRQQARRQALMED